MLELLLLGAALAATAVALLEVMGGACCAGSSVVSPLPPPSDQPTSFPPRLPARRLYPAVPGAWKLFSGWGARSRSAKPTLKAA